VETTGHILWSCLSTRDAWSICGKRLQKTSVENEEFIHIVEELLDKLDDEEFSILGIFNHHNLIVRKALERKC